MAVGNTFAERAPRRLTKRRARAGPPNYSLHEVLTVSASIVECVKRSCANQRPTIAGVYLNRVASGMQSDADPLDGAVCDGVSAGQRPVAENAGVAGGIRHCQQPHNTYLNVGLPPRPTAAPGLSSIEAALNPEQHNYLLCSLAGWVGLFLTSLPKLYEEEVQNVAEYMGQ